MDLGFLGAWGLAVLIASMSGTQLIKNGLKRKGFENDYVFMALPGGMSTLGAIALAYADQLDWKFVPLFIFVLTFGGNYFYRVWQASRAPFV